jgi:hypothetical protein
MTTRVNYQYVDHRVFIDAQDLIGWLHAQTMTLAKTNMTVEERTGALAAFQSLAEWLQKNTTQIYELKRVPIEDTNRFSVRDSNGKEQ